MSSLEYFFLPPPLHYTPEQTRVVENGNIIFFRSRATVRVTPPSSTREHPVRLERKARALVAVFDYCPLASNGCGTFQL